MNRFGYIYIGLIVFFTFAGNVFAKNFTDVPQSHKNSVAIDKLSEKGVIKGYSNGKFNPGGLINRAEAVKVLVKSRFSSKTIETALNWHYEAGHNYVMFPDVAIDQWFGKYVEVSYQNKVISGYPSGQFEPNNNINFAEALKIILEAYKIDTQQTKFKPNKLLLIERGSWYESYFNTANKYGLLNKNKVYHPAQLITRGEFVEIIYRIEDVLSTKKESFTTTKVPYSNEYRVTIPKLGIVNVDVNFANVYDPSQALEVLKNGLGQYLNPPDKQEKLVLFGHSSGFAWDNSNYKTILREIDKLKPGDKIYLNYQEKGYVYEIYNNNIIPASLDYTLIENPTQNELTLYTCWPPDSVAKRYVVYGKPV